MFQTDRTEQRQLFAFTPRDLVAEDSDVWLYIDLFENVDVLDFDSSYSSQGQEAKDPKLMLRTMFYALTHGVVSGRKLQDACRNDNRFIVLSGDLRPDRRTFDRFIKRHGHAFDKLFVQIVRLAQAMGLVNLGRVAIDGSKFKASADKSMVYEKMDRAIGHIQESLSKLKEDLKKANQEDATELEGKLSRELKSQEVRMERIKRAKAQIEKESEEQHSKQAKKNKRKPKAAKALADPEALSLGVSAKFSFGYNVQAGVDEKNQIVVSATVHDNSSDSRAFIPVLDDIKKNCGKYPSEALGDSGYKSLENIKETIRREVTPVIAQGREYATLPESSCEQIFKGVDDNTYFCLFGKKLKFRTHSSSGHVLFNLSKSFCRGCPMQARCNLFGKKHPSVLNDENRQVMIPYLARAREEEFEKSYRRRKVIVEPVFGNIKNKGIKINVKGVKAVQTWWHIACTAHNLEKMVRSIANNGGISFRNCRNNPLVTAFHEIKAIFWGNLKFLPAAC